MFFMKVGSKALAVPLVVAALWLLPADRPDAEVAGATETPALADASPITATPDPSPESTTTALVASSAPVLADEETSSPTTTVPPTTTTQTTEAPSTSIDASLSAVPTFAVPTTTAISIGDQALERVTYDWRSRFPDWTIDFRGPRNGIRALTYPQEKQIEIFVRTSDTPATLHRVFAHELGHVVDVELNSDDDRNDWRDQRGISSSSPWWPSAEAPDFATGAGDFAEAFAVWETGVTTRSTVSEQPTRADLELLRELSAG
ncbi:MAG: hypothetical protein ACI81L_002042 [Verrucomicrobiales bacterium]|jgi:hypothetical protein